MIPLYMAATKSINNIINNRNITLTEFYDIAFGRIGKSNDLYLGIWNNYFEKNINNAPSMIFILLINIIKNIVFDSRRNIINAEIKSELSSISDFFDKVRDYIESKYIYPNNLSENPILETEFEQITYLINLIITPAILNILLNQIYEGFFEMDATKFIVQDKNLVFEQIISTKFNGHTLKSYLKDVLPRLAIKYFTITYNDIDDHDKKITNANDLFIPLIQIIKNNRLIIINDDSLLVKNINDYLIPFMVNTYQNFIHYLRLTIYGYERYLLNTYQLVKILESLI